MYSETAVCNRTCGEGSDVRKSEREPLSMGANWRLESLRYPFAREGMSMNADKIANGLTAAQPTSASGSCTA